MIKKYKIPIDLVLLISLSAILLTLIGTWSELFGAGNQLYTLFAFLFAAHIVLLSAINKNETYSKRRKYFKNNIHKFELVFNLTLILFVILSIISLLTYLLNNPGYRVVIIPEDLPIFKSRDNFIIQGIEVSRFRYLLTTVSSLLTLNIGIIVIHLIILKKLLGDTGLKGAIDKLENDFKELKQELDIKEEKQSN